MHSRPRPPRRLAITAGVLSILCVSALAGEMSAVAADRQVTAAKRKPTTCPRGQVRIHGRCIVKVNDPYGGSWAEPRNKNYPASGVHVGLGVQTATRVFFSFSIVKDCAPDGSVGGNGYAVRRGKSFSYSYSDPNHGSLSISGTFSTAKKGFGHASATVKAFDSHGNLVDCTGEANLTFVRP
jgi:hypothetical protein